MRVLIISIYLIFIVGCSDKIQNRENRDRGYQRYLHFQADKTLKEEQMSYDQN